jgi:hypothetical protein
MTASENYSNNDGKYLINAIAIFVFINYFILNYTCTIDVRVHNKEVYHRVYNYQQRCELEKEFVTNEFINAQRKAELSTALKLTER